MRVSRILAITLLALLLTTTSDARRGGGGRSSSRSGRTRSGYSYNRYSGLVIIAGPNGSYYQGYGDSCPYGCAVSGRCGTEKECKMSWSDYFWLRIVVAFLVCWGCGWCKNEDENSYKEAEKKSKSSSSSSSSNSEKKKKKHQEPHVDGMPAPNPYD